MYVYVPDLRGKGHYKVMGGVCMSVRPSVCRVPRPNSRTERPRKPKIGRMETYRTGNSWTYLEVKRSKVKGQGHQAGLCCHRECTNAGRRHYNFLKISVFYGPLMRDINQNDWKVKAIQNALLSDNICHCHRRRSVNAISHAANYFLFSCCILASMLTASHVHTLYAQGQPIFVCRWFPKCCLVFPLCIRSVFTVAPCRL